MISKNQIKLIRSLEQRKHRKAEQLFVAEGPKVVGDLLSAGYHARLICGVADYLSVHHPQAQQVVECTDDELRRVSFLQHPQSVIAVFEIPQQPAIDTWTSPSGHGDAPFPLSLALDGIQDPGNLGTIVRLADWFGIDTIYCSPETVDVFNPKVVQATMGSLARVRVVYTSLPQLISSLPPSTPVYGTLLDGQSLYDQQLSPHGLIVMGNEGNGLSPELRQLVTHRLLIPSYPPNRPTAESLNVAIATAIVCAEFRRVAPL